MSEAAPARRNLLAGLKTREAPADDAAIAAVAERHGFTKAGEGGNASEAPAAVAAPPAEPMPAPAAASDPVAPQRRASVAAPTATPEPEAIDEDDAHIVLRRRRRLRHRTQQFNVRLREDTIDAIYAESNARDIPLAQVIEEMVELFLAQKQGRVPS